MADRSPRDELHHLVDSLPEDLVEQVLDEVRRRVQPRVTPPDSAFSWMGTGVAKGGRTDLARNVDEYLAEGFGRSPRGDGTDEAVADAQAAEQARQSMQPAHAVVGSLAELHGPRSGQVTPPLHIDWSTTNSYDLADDDRVRTMYATVLREAKNPDDLRVLLNADILRRVWSDLSLPDSVRDAWETAHPELAAEHAEEPVVDVDLEERFLANVEVQGALREARAHPERQAPRPENTARREALREGDSGE